MKNFVVIALLILALSACRIIAAGAGFYLGAKLGKKLIEKVER